MAFFPDGAAGVESVSIQTVSDADARGTPKGLRAVPLRSLDGIFSSGLEAGS